mmetsp:Transcript_36344/g.92861  ORF Transcript_36344/g.92861 Transcript_36344/m.92861 type:complete len:139 (-) Transcript_36344:110-526(-)
MASGGGGHYGLLSLADEVPAVVPHEGLSPLWSYGPATQDNPCSAEPPGGHQCGVPPQVSCPASHKLTDSFLAAKPYLPCPTPRIRPYRRVQRSATWSGAPAARCSARGSCRCRRRSCTWMRAWPPALSQKAGALSCTC